MSTSIIWIPVCFKLVIQTSTNHSFFLSTTFNHSYANHREEKNGIKVGSPLVVHDKSWEEKPPIFHGKSWFSPRSASSRRSHRSHRSHSSSLRTCRQLRFPDGHEVWHLAWWGHSMRMQWGYKWSPLMPLSLVSYRNMYYIYICVLFFSFDHYMNR